MEPEHARKRGHSRAHDLVSSLTQQILLGTFKPGDKLPSENTLVREHGVSRTVVREALSKLQASGLVEPRHGIGTFVMERQAQAGLRVAAESAANVRDLLELRIGLEGQAAALAALRRDEGHLARMRQALNDYQDLAAAGDSCIEADRRFHLLIAEATGNLYFTEMLLQLGNGLIPRNRMAQAERAGPSWRGKRTWPTWSMRRSSMPSADKTRMPRGRQCACTCPTAETGYCRTDCQAV